MRTRIAPLCGIPLSGPMTGRSRPHLSLREGLEQPPGGGAKSPASPIPSTVAPSPAAPRQAIMPDRSLTCSRAGSPPVPAQPAWFHRLDEKWLRPAGRRTGVGLRHLPPGPVGSDTRLAPERSSRLAASVTRSCSCRPCAGRCGDWAPSRPRLHYLVKGEHRRVRTAQPGAIPRRRPCSRGGRNLL